MKHVFSTTKKVKQMERKEFVAVAPDPEHEIFVVYVAALNISFDLDDKIHLLRKTKIAHLEANKALTRISSEYIDFEVVVLPELAAELL